MWRSFFPTPSLVFLPVGRAYIATNSRYSERAFFHRGKSRFRQSRLAAERGSWDRRNFQRLCASGAPPYMRDLGPRPPPVSPLEGAKNFFSIAIFSVTAADSTAVLSALGAVLGSLTSAPEVRGPLCQIWGRGSLNQNFTFFDPEIFCGLWDQRNS